MRPMNFQQLEAQNNILLSCGWTVCIPQLASMQSFLSSLKVYIYITIP
jgi:hypothetical protein